MGAVTEQSANLYATKMAEQGFVAMSVDLLFWGESDGRPRNLVSPDLYAEAFSAAVDFLGTQPFVDRNRIGAIGVCGSGSFVISAAKIDPRLKAIATVSMYDMGAANRNALNHSLTVEQRKQIIAAAAEQRYVEFAGGETQYAKGPDDLDCALAGIDRFEDFLKSIGCPIRFSELGIDGRLIEAYARDTLCIMNDGNGNLPARPPMAGADIVGVLRAAL
ncbi:MAG: dienelactone hydrolase family protein [Rhodospirillales bacterium]|nr:dienelactone hydrolase family protein [Rhodospirillales bacterium]